MSSIDFEVLDQDIGLVTINRPDKRNALDEQSMDELTQVLEADETQHLSALVLAGAGKHFCAGVDLGEIGATRPQRARPVGPRLFTAFRQCGPVVIGSVHGYALGLGSGIAMACDLVVAADDAEFGYPAIAHGLVNGVTMVGLKEVVGARVALELLVTGRRVPADEALALGMVNALAPADELRKRSLELARTIASHRKLAVQTTKQFFHESSDLSFASALLAGERVVQVVRKAKDPERAVAVPSSRSTTP